MLDSEQKDTIQNLQQVVQSTVTGLDIIGDQVDAYKIIIAQHLDRLDFTYCATRQSAATSVSLIAGELAESQR